MNRLEALTRINNGINTINRRIEDAGFQEFYYGPHALQNLEGTFSLSVSNVKYPSELVGRLLVIFGIAFLCSQVKSSDEPYHPPMPTPRGTPVAAQGADAAAQATPRVGFPEPGTHCVTAQELRQAGKAQNPFRLAKLMLRDRLYTSENLTGSGPVFLYTNGLGDEASEPEKYANLSAFIMGDPVINDLSQLCEE